MLQTADFRILLKWGARKNFKVRTEGLGSYSVVYKTKELEIDATRPEVVSFLIQSLSTIEFSQ